MITLKIFFDLSLGRIFLSFVFVPNTCEKQKKFFHFLVFCSLKNQISELFRMDEMLNVGQYTILETKNDRIKKFFENLKMQIVF